MKKTSVLKWKIYVSIFALNFSANNISIIHKDHNILLHAFIFIMGKIKTFK